MSLLRREADGRISKWHFTKVSDCLTHDAIFVKVALSHLLLQLFGKASTLANWQYGVIMLLTLGTKPFWLTF
jgi:hypothetical protein